MAMKNVTVITAETIEHKGKRYTKVGAGELAKKGDVIQRTTNRAGWFTNDAFYKIKRVDSVGDVYVKDDEGDAVAFCRDNGVLFREVAEQKAEQPTFKVGDKVRMLSDSLYGKKYKGKTGVVFEGADEDGDISVTPDGGGARGLFKADSLELLTEKAPVTPQADDEITFEGAKYRKVDRKAQAGDVVILKSGVKVTPWLTLGKAYEVSYANGEARIYGDGGDRIVLYRDEYDYNRTPETVDVYEKVEAEYVPQEGDIVVVVSAPAPRVAVGDIGKVEDNDGTFRVVVPGKVNAANWQTADDVRKATPAEVETYEKALHKASFKVGDYVKIVKSYAGFDGEIAKITEIGEYSTTEGIADFEIEHLPKKGGLFAVKAEQIVKATEQEVADATKPKLKAGDFVKFDKDRLGITEGKAYEVIDHVKYGLVVVDDNKMHDSAIRSDRHKFEVLTADDAKWAKIGRKVGEFKKGDIVRVSTRADAHRCAGNLVTIAEFRPSDKLGRLAWFEDYGRSITGQYLELIAPVESLFNA